LCCLVPSADEQCGVEAASKRICRQIDVSQNQLQPVEKPKPLRNVIRGHRIIRGKTYAKLRSRSSGLLSGGIKSGVWRVVWSLSVGFALEITVTSLCAGKMQQRVVSSAPHRFWELA